jgi:predicted unusual protein kinase regulating ubiquinone biosynthesis (AarF/ABC1/UbiB family)
MQKLKGSKPGDDDSGFARREAQRFVRELGKLKGTYVKIGQMMALFGEHFLPPVLAEAMHDLGDNTQAMGWESVEPVFRESLGDRYGELDIQQEALAAASLAQVHLATVRATGEQICLKVQYPGLADVIDSDFDAVVRMLVLARWLPAGRDLDDWLQSMRTHLHNEIDYPREARLTERMGELVRDVDVSGVSYRVPRLYSRYCSDVVLALEYMQGLSVTAEPVAALSL